MCLGIQKFYVVECLIECLYHADRRSPPAKSSNQGSCSNYIHLSHYSLSKMFGPLHFEENSYLPWICLFVSKGGEEVTATARVHWYPPYDDCRICPSILRALRRILFEWWRYQRLGVRNQTTPRGCCSLIHDRVWDVETYQAWLYSFRGARVQTCQAPARYTPERMEVDLKISVR